MKIGTMADVGAELRDGAAECHFQSDLSFLFRNPVLHGKRDPLNPNSGKHSNVMPANRTRRMFML